MYVAYSSYNEGGVTYPGGIAKTTNGGATWQATNSGLTQVVNSNVHITSNYECIVASAVSPGTLYTSDNGWSSQGIFRSTNYGGSWVAVLGDGAAIPPHAYAAGPGMTALAVDPKGPAVFGGDSDAVFRSTAGGASWIDSTSFQPTGAVNWSGRGFSGLCTNGVYFNRPAHQTVLMAADDGKFWQSTDNMQTWEWGGIGLNHYSGGTDCKFAGKNGSTIYALFGDGPAKSTNSGSNWTYLNLPSGAHGDLGGVYALPSTPNTVWMTVGGQLYKSIDGGKSWSKISSGGINSDGKLWGITAAPNSPSTFYVSGGAGIWKTTKGTSFSLMPGSPIGASVTIDPTNTTRLYAVGGGLWRYWSGNNTWRKMVSDTTIRCVAVNPSNGSQIVYGTGDNPYHDISFATGVWLSTNGGSTWSQQNNDLAELRCSCIAFNPCVSCQVIVGTEGRGFWVGTIGR
jgi:hypothetical protein